MSNAAATAAMNRWTGDAMQKRVAGRYAAERRFRFFGLAAVSLSVAFLAFLLINMAWKGLGGFTQTETKLVIDFPRSDLLLDPATLRGPQAEESVASAGLGESWNKPRSPSSVKAGANCSAGPVRAPWASS